jgi:hypothetical protein
MQATTLHLERQIQIGDMPLHEARAQWAQWRTRYGFKLDATPLLTAPTGNLKLNLSEAPTFGLTLSAASHSGINVCLWSTPACRAACVLTTSFRGRDAKNIRAREAKTTGFDSSPVAFLTLLNDEIHKAVKKWGSVKVRLNVASDIRWEFVAPWLFEIEGASFYDYTKAPLLEHRAPGPNYRLVYSVSELPQSEAYALRVLASGGNVAIVFNAKKHQLPATWNGYRVIDGDLSDDRTTDPYGVVVGLAAKAGARGDKTGFVKPGVAS